MSPDMLSTCNIFWGCFCQQGHKLDPKDKVSTSKQLWEICFSYQDRSFWEADFFQNILTLQTYSIIPAVLLHPAVWVNTDSSEEVQREDSTRKDGGALGKGGGLVLGMVCESGAS